jgi:hypothetical protein
MRVRRSCALPTHDAGVTRANGARADQCKRLVLLSITHILRAEQVADFDSGEPRESSADDGVASRSITRTVQVAAQPSQLREARVEHRHPEDTPTEDAECRQQVDEARSRPQCRLLGATAGHQDRVECLDLPALRMPIELLACLQARGDRQVKSYAAWLTGPTTTWL